MYDRQEITKIAFEFIRRFRDEFGYDDAQFQGFTVSDNGVYFGFYLEDEFQKRVSYDHRTQHGGFYIYEIGGEFCIPADFKSREMRELSVMLAQQAETTVLRDMLVSASGREYMRRLIEERSKYAQLPNFKDVPF